jgi:hypothetical protein
MTQRISWIRHASLAVALGVVSAALVLSQQSGQNTQAVVEWSANLTGAKDASLPLAEAVQTPATGKATAVFDFEHKSLTLTVAAENISGVQQVQLRTARSRGDLSGPIISTIYDFHDGAFTGSVSKIISGSDFTRIATSILNGQDVVVVTTEAHRDGEIAGPILMHKSYN